MKRNVFCFYVLADDGTVHYMHGKNEKEIRKKLGLEGYKVVEIKRIEVKDNE